MEYGQKKSRKIPGLPGIADEPWIMEGQETVFTDLGIPLILFIFLFMYFFYRTLSPFSTIGRSHRR